MIDINKSIENIPLEELKRAFNLAEMQYSKNQSKRDNFKDFVQSESEVKENQDQDMLLKRFKKHIVYAPGAETKTNIEIELNIHKENDHKLTAYNWISEKIELSKNSLDDVVLKSHSSIIWNKAAYEIKENKFIDCDNREKKLNPFFDKFVENNKLVITHRNKAHFKKATAILLDFDDGTTKEKILNHSFLKKYNLYLYSSKSHKIEKKDKPACERWHLMLFLNNPIDSLDVFESSINTIIELTKDIKVDKACKDGARYFTASTRENFESYLILNKKNLDITELEKLQPIEQKTEIGISSSTSNESPFDAETELYNNYTLEQITACLNELSSCKIEYNDYQKLLGFVKNESVKFPDLPAKAAYILSQNPNYTDKEQDISLKIESFKENQVNVWKYANVFNLTKSFNKEFKQPINTVQKEHYFNTAIDWKKEPIAFVKDVVRFVKKFNTYYVKLKEGWLEVGKKISDLDGYFRALKIEVPDDKKPKKIMIHRYVIENLGIQTAVYEPIANPHNTDTKAVNLFPKIYDKLKPKGKNKEQVQKELNELYEIMRKIYLNKQPKNIETFFFNCLAAYTDYRKIPVDFQVTGEQGTGKSLLSELLKRLISSKSIISISDHNQVLGQFNSIIERKTIVVLEEALFKGDRKAANKLKDLITSPRIIYNAKFKNPIESENHTNYISFSNYDVIHHLDNINSRREFILSTFNCYENEQEKKAVFDRYIELIKDDDIIHELRNELLKRAEKIDLRSFYNVPLTKQKIKVTLECDSVMRFVLNLVENDFYIKIDNDLEKNIKNEKFTTKDLYESFTNSLTIYDEKISDQAFSKRLKKYFYLPDSQPIKIDNKVYRGWYMIRNAYDRVSDDIKNLIPHQDQDQDQDLIKDQQEFKNL